MPPLLQHPDRQVSVGELGRRVGVSAELLRAWERRYGLLSPARTAGGHRRYTDIDERRVRRMLEHLGAGVSAAEAARLARQELATEGPPLPAAGPELGHKAPAWAAIGDQLRRSLDQLDEARANGALDRLLSGFALATVVREAVLPYMHELGRRWQHDGDAVIAQEHFASVLLRGRLLGLARGWGGGHGPMALLACFPGEHHDLGLICFGLALRDKGWRVTFLGSDTPFLTITETARLLQPAVVVLAATFRREDDDVADGLAAIAAQAPLALAGAGVHEREGTLAGVRFLSGDPFAAAATIADDESDRRAH